MSTARLDAPVLSKSFGEASLFRHANTGERYVKVFPGKLFGTASPVLLVTLLGSCVSACIRDRDVGIGGLNHFMLPGGETTHNDPNGYHRYGQSAMDTLLAALEQRGARRNRLEIKLFGGGNMMLRSTSEAIGEQNIEFAQNYFREMGLQVATSDLGDSYARKIIYNPCTGVVQVKRISSSERELGSVLASCD